MNSPSPALPDLLPQLLDQLIALGHTARHLRLALGRNGHHTTGWQGVWGEPEQGPGAAGGQAPRCCG